MLLELIALKELNKPVILPQPEPEVTVQVEAKPKPKPKIKTYQIVKGDDLTKIGAKHNVKWQRIWAKNKKIKHPDIIREGDKIIIPQPSEKLKRKLPATFSLPDKTPGVQAPGRAGGSFSPGNTYDYGYCTWYVKNKRGSSLPNSLGNANTWYSRAQSIGMSVGDKPRAGAVGTTTRGLEGHVVYVESVNKDGSINISEMNSPTWGVVTHRAASASEFLYIY